MVDFSQKKICHIFCRLAFVLVLTVPSLSTAGERVVGVLLSREIAPYVAMVEGLESQLVNLPVQRFFLDANGRPYSLTGRELAFDLSQFDAIVAVGPEALHYLLPRIGKVPMVYGMVLNPGNLINGTSLSQPPCGVILNLPIEAQLASLLHYFPEMDQLGVLYDPANNQGWFDNAVRLAAAMGVKLIPLQVSKQAGRLAIVGDLSLPDAILFIPDRTIISKVVIQYVTKEALLRDIPVVGYNQFFYDSGAALSFIIDYHEVGKQVAELVKQKLTGNNCPEVTPPVFHTRVNAEVWRVLGLDPAKLQKGASD